MKIVKYVFLLPLVVTLFSCGGEGSEPFLEEEAVNLKTESGI